MTRSVNIEQVWVCYLDSVVEINLCFAVEIKTTRQKLTNREGSSFYMYMLLLTCGKV